MVDDDMIDENMDEYIQVQSLINAGAWNWEGAIGRRMMECISAGVCMLGHKPARDYYGNLVPSRTMVKAGTKGSFDFVAKHLGKRRANQLAKVQ